MSTSVSRHFLSSATLCVFAACLCSAQNIAPAHSGTVHYFEGDVTVDGVKLVSQVARFTEMKEQSVLHTGLGRAEILLTPGVLLRVGENSSVKMLDNRLMSTRLEFLSGVAMVEAVDSGSTVKDPPVTIVYKDFEAQTLHYGIFELKSDPNGQVRVFKGEAKVNGNGASLNVKEGNMVDLTTTMASAKFDTKDADDLYLWSRDRSAYLSAGNMSSARTLNNSGYGSGNGLGYAGTGYGNLGFGSGYAYNGWTPSMWNGFSGGWYYNSYLDMYTFMPFAGTMYSPFGYGLYNPVTIAYVYTPGYYWSGAGGARTGTTTGVPLSTLPSTTTNKGASSLPRLGVTASLRPSLTAPAKGTEPSAPTASIAAHSAFNTTGGGTTTTSSARPVASAPATVSAPAAGGRTASAGKR